jgi:tetratricopeptide (TPR) repeat protein
MRVLNSLGEVERQRSKPEAALAWYDRSLELATRLGYVEGQATARSNRAMLITKQAQGAADAVRGRQLLEQAIAEDRAALVLREQLGQPASIGISHNNLANHLRLAGSLDEAKEHARQALAILEQIREPRIWQTLLLLERIAEARGDAAAAADWRRRKDAARSEAKARSGDHALPPDLVLALLQAAAQARTAGTTLEQALAEAGADAGLLATLARVAPWLVAHLQALAAGGPRPVGDVPGPYRDLVEQAWQPPQAP